MKIIIEEDLTGLAPKDERYMAYDDNSYEGFGSLVGIGPTPQAAQQDLLDKMTGREDARSAEHRETKP